MQLKHLLSDYMRHYTLSCSVSFNMDRMCFYFMLIKHWTEAMQERMWTVTPIKSSKTVFIIWNS